MPGSMVIAWNSIPDIIRWSIPKSYHFSWKEATGMHWVFNVGVRERFWRVHPRNEEDFCFFEKTV
jgi:hypothetical protein